MGLFTAQSYFYLCAWSCGWERRWRLVPHGKYHIWRVHLKQASGREESKRLDRSLQRSKKCPTTHFRNIRAKPLLRWHKLRDFCGKSGLNGEHRSYFKPRRWSPGRNASASKAYVPLWRLVLPERPSRPPWCHFAQAVRHSWIIQIRKNNRHLWIETELVRLQLNVLRCKEVCFGTRTADSNEASRRTTRQKAALDEEWSNQRSQTCGFTRLEGVCCSYQGFRSTWLILEL